MALCNNVYGVMTCKLCEEKSILLISIKTGIVLIKNIVVL